MFWFLQPGVTLTDVLMRILSVLVIVFAILPLHELAHGWVASKLGDNTAKYNGRLTLNPVAHIDPIGAIAILLFGFGWAKAVPVNPRNFKNPKAGMAITALAGPVSNLLAALVGGILFNCVLLIPMTMQVFTWVSVFFTYYISINVGLAVFNLIPVPPLDGSRIIGIFLSDRAWHKFYQYENYIMIGMFVLLFTGVLDAPLGFMQNGCFKGVMWLADLPFRLFGL